MKKMLLCLALNLATTGYGMDSYSQKVTLTPQANEIMRAAITNNTSGIKTILADSTYDINCQEPKFEQLESIKHCIFLDHRISKEPRLRRSQYSPLFYIIQAGHAKAFKSFMKRKDINWHLTDSHGQTVLHIAVENKRLSFLKDLLKKIDPTVLNQANNYGNSPLMCAERVLYHAVSENLPDHNKIEKIIQLLLKKCNKQ